MSRKVINPFSRIAAAVLVPIVAATSIVLAPQASAESLSDYLNLPLSNRLADQGPGGVNPALPTELTALEALVGQARNSGLPASNYAALLYQLRLVQATTEAGIDLASWNPDLGFDVNRPNMIKSYEYYQAFQLEHRELQWAGMAGIVGADFGGGIADMALATTIYELPGLQQLGQSIIDQVVSAFGPEFVESLPQGLRNLASYAGDITTEDLRWFIRQILIMQKAIFTDLMPMHYIYTHEGLDGIKEFYDAGLIPQEIFQAWNDIASGDTAKIASANETLLRREQFNVVGSQMDDARNYGNGVGSALAYAMTLMGSPSIAGVPPLRAYRQFELTGNLPDGRTATLVAPIPNWDWTVFEDRWQYISTELLPRYSDAVQNNWGSLEARFRTPYEIQWETSRVLTSIPRFIAETLAATRLEVQ
ncbi:MAG: DUF2515 family protein [Mycobacteriaceae bacterium]